MILVVDDSPTCLKMAREALISAGYEVITADQVNEAVKVLANKIPQLMLIDLLMWPASGMDLVRGVRMNKKFDKIPIIIYSAHDEPKLRQSATQAGVQGYLVKPMDPEELVKAVKAWVKPHK